jgi:hypothetical protein
MVKKKKLFNMDLHISVIADFVNLFPEFEITEWCMSGHSWVMGKQRVVPHYINPSTWINMDMDMIKRFQDTYDEFLSTFDGFICGHPNTFAMIFEKYNKPIILINSCRIDLPFCWSHKMDMVNNYKACLLRLQEKKLLIPVSNNLADALYSKVGYNVEMIHIPSLCAYTELRYNVKNVTNNTFLLYHGDLPNHNLVTKKSDLPQPFKWSDLCNFKGIIHFPYEISTMSMFEHFTAGIPLFFPSIKYMEENVAIQSVSAYWKEDLPDLLSMFKDKKIWLENADMYKVFNKSPNVYFFDSIEHLFALLENFEYKDDHNKIRKHKKYVRRMWEETFKKYNFTLSQ